MLAAQIMKRTGFLLLAGVFLSHAIFGAEPVVKSVVWSPHGAERGCRVNLGPTGAQAWMRGCQFEIMTVESGSPSDGILQPGDRVLGVGDTRFSEEGDSRMLLGHAIGAAEAADGALALTIRREGREQRVTVRVPVIGAFAASWPFNCAKSQRILDAACAYLLDAQLPSGKVVTDGGHGTYTAGLLLLASGDARYFDGARRAAYEVADTDLETIDYSNWALGYGGLLLAEYYLATGDTNVLARLQSVVDHLARGQMRCGSWGHNNPSGGYGALNQSGMVCALTMALAQECGLRVDRVAFDRAVSFYSRYAELGAVPYGDHPPGVSLPDDNGKNSLAAVLCWLLPQRRAAAAVFAQSVAISYWLREEGHTGGYFSMMWGAPACALAGPEALRTFLDYQTWYYNLCRTWRGALVMLPYHEALTRFDDSGYIWFGGDFTTGGMALMFALPQRQLRVLGAPRSVFGADLTGPLLDARQAYQARRWNDFDSAIAAAGKVVSSAEEKYWLSQLTAVAARVRASTQRTRQQIEANLAEGDAYRAAEQYRALKRFLGDADEVIVALEKRFADGTVQWHSRTGKKYYQAWEDLRGVGVMSWLPYGEQAKERLAAVPGLQLKLWETLAPTNSAAGGQLEFALVTTNYSALRLQLRSPRDAHSRVFLNGTQVAEATRGQRSGYAKIELDATARRLLRPGTNVLAITSTSTGTGNNALDVGLEGVPVELLPAATPAWTGPVLTELPASVRVVFDRARMTFAATRLEFPENPAIPERMRVRDSADRFKKTLETGFDALAENECMEWLRSPLSYARFLASRSLARRGAAGRQAAVAGLTDSDWRVRSASCDVLAALPKDSLPVDDAVLSRLAELVADENAWVRFRAATALGAVGRPDAKAATALVKAAQDETQWVRIAALGALNQVASEPRVIVAALTAALRVPSTSFGVLGRAVGLIEKLDGNDAELVSALAFAVEHPGEGMGADSVNKAMEQLVRLDPDGQRAVPVLARVAAGGDEYDRLRGNPRLRAVEMLGKLGARAAAAKPVLETIVGGTIEKEEPLRAAARTALAQMTGGAGAE